MTILPVQNSAVVIDISVSWNFKHIVYFDKIIMFNNVNQEAGYKTIQIYSHREVTIMEKKFDAEKVIKKCRKSKTLVINSRPTTKS